MITIGLYMLLAASIVGTVYGAGLMVYYKMVQNDSHGTTFSCLLAIAFGSVFFMVVDLRIVWLLQNVSQ